MIRRFENCCLITSLIAALNAHRTIKALNSLLISRRSRFNHDDKLHPRTALDACESITNYQLRLIMQLVRMLEFLNINNVSTDSVGWRKSISYLSLIVQDAFQPP